MSGYNDTLKKLITGINKKRDCYGLVLVKSVIIKSERGWNNCATKFVPLCISETEKHEKKFDYGDLVIFETTISLDELLDLVKKIPEHGNFSFKIESYEIEFDGEYLQNGYKYDSGEDLLSIGWFFSRFQFRGKNKRYPKEPIVTKDLPLFPSLRDAIQEHLGIDMNRYTDIYGIFVCLPNYGAKIDQVKVSPKEIAVKIEPNLLDLKNIVGKVRYQLKSKIGHGDIEFKNQTGTFPIESIPDSLYVVLLSKKDSELIDSRRYYSSWDSLPNGVTINVPNYELEELIRHGETETVEFKTKISKGEKIAITAVAFANNRGGVIIFGVNDYAEVVGLKDGKIEDQITNILRNNCNPKINFEIHRRIIDEKIIVLTSIKEGTDKPYFVRRGAAHIRVNGTNKHLNRQELGEILEAKKSEPMMGY